MYVELYTHQVASLGLEDHAACIDRRYYSTRAREIISH